MSASPSALTLNAGSPGASGSSTLSFTPLNTFNGPVHVTAAVSPTVTGGVTATPPGDFTLSSSTTQPLGLQAGTAPGVYTVTVSATSGSLSHSATVTVTVPTPAFSISVSPTSRTVTRGSSTTYTVTVARTGGYTGTISLGVTGQGTDVASFSPASILSPGTTSTLTVKTVTSDKRATKTLTITATGAGLSGTKSANVTLTLR